MHRVHLIVIIYIQMLVWVGVVRAHCVRQGGHWVPQAGPTPTLRRKTRKKGGSNDGFTRFMGPLILIRGSKLITSSRRANLISGVIDTSLLVPAIPDFVKTQSDIYICSSSQT